ncbi:MAG TPA: hypothetical protein VMB50_13435 [Myxococcales bacterium]|nr:hypothetical protein [Myxococcales bacterium]
MPDSAMQGTLSALFEKIKVIEEQAAKLKNAANVIAETSGQPPPYPDIGGPTQARIGIRSDQFYSCLSPAAAGRAFLSYRGKDAGSAALEEIYEAIKRGGFAFGEDVKDEKAALRIALGKDGAVKRLPNGSYGLQEWYPKRLQDTKTTKNGKEQPDADEEAEGSEEADK